MSVSRVLSSDWTEAAESPAQADMECTPLKC